MNWLQLIYQYAAGGLFFFITMFVCFRLGAANLKIGSDRKALVYLIAGFFGYLTLHTVWILLASL